MTMRPRLAAIAVFGIFLLLSAPAVRSQPAQPTQAGGVQRCGSGDVVPSGLVVVLPPGHKSDPAHELQALKNPYISGVALQINWRDLEAAEGQLDWSRLDALFAAAEGSKKWVHLLIFPGFFSPAWALEGVETDRFAIQYGPGHGTETLLPMPWDRVYLNRWFAFLKQLSDRFGRSPAFRLIGADGPTSVSAEMTLPIKPADAAKWRAHGYTARRYQDAWRKVFQVYASDFPNQCISLSGPGIPLLDQGRIADRRAAHARAREAVIEEAHGVFGNRLAIQWSDLHAGQAAVEAPEETGTLIGYSGRFITGLQMRSAAEGGGSAVMGAAGDPPLALRRAVDKGMKLNAAGRHIAYLEIYEPDVIAPEMQPVLQYAAGLLARR
jgi:hypothetical protein